MKLRFVIISICGMLLIGCTKSSSSPEFINQYTGRYLFNTDELIEVYFENEKLFLSWRGAEKINPLKINDSTFFIKEMNKKIQFLTRASDEKVFIRQIYSQNEDSLTYDFKKLALNEKIPSEFLANKEYDKAMQAYLDIKEKDSLNPALNRRYFNRLGYKALENKNLDGAIQIFKMNVALFPTSSNVYDSLGEAYLVSGDTLQALTYYKKALSFDSGSNRIREIINNLEKKEE